MIESLSFSSVLLPFLMKGLASCRLLATIRSQGLGPFFQIEFLKAVRTLDPQMKEPANQESLSLIFQGNPPWTQELRPSRINICLSQAPEDLGIRPLADKKLHYKDFLGRTSSADVSPDRRLVQARLARAKKAVATIRRHAPGRQEVTHERQESSHNFADFINTYVYIYIYMHYATTYVCMLFISIYTYTHTYTYIYIYIIYIYIYHYVYIYMYTYIHIHAYICIYTYIYIYLSIYLYIYPSIYLSISLPLSLSLYIYI